MGRRKVGNKEVKSTFQATVQETAMENSKEQLEIVVIVSGELNSVMRLFTFWSRENALVKGKCACKNALLRGRLTNVFIIILQTKHYVFKSEDKL